MPAAFAGLSKSLPALAYADEMQGRAASLGYDWPDLEGVIDKIAEEASELLAAEDAEHRREEFGDLLFVMVNLGRKLGIDAEAALRSASRKFASRFARVERLADEQGLQLRALGLDALDELWQDAKREEAASREHRLAPRRNDEHRRRPALPGRWADTGPDAPGLRRAGRAEVGGRIARLPPG